MIWSNYREKLVALLDRWRRDVARFLKDVDQGALNVMKFPIPQSQQLRGSVMQKCSLLSINICAQADLRPLLYDDWFEVAQEKWYDAPDGQTVKNKSNKLRLLAARSLVALTMGE